jgi:hypothetical protein
MPQQVYDVAGSYTFTWPTGVSTLTAQVQASGAGGSANDGGGGGWGGGAGAYAKGTVSKVGATDTVQVGAGRR